MLDTIAATFGLGTIVISTDKHSSTSITKPAETQKNERIIDRLDSYLLISGIAEEKLIVSARLDHDALNKARAENNDLDNKQIEKILKASPDLNKDWLIKGEGEMKNGNAILIIEKRSPLARILQVLKEEGVSLEEFAKAVNSNSTLFDNVIKWPYDSKGLVLGNDKAVRSWVNAFCDVFPRYSKYWILTGKTSKYNYPIPEDSRDSE